MNLLRIFCMFCFMSNAFVLWAQVIDTKIAAMLSENDRAKIEKADSYIKQGNEILFANFTYNKDKLFQRNPNYIQLSENILVGKRVSRLLFDTKSYYKAGFEGAIQVLKPYINTYLNKEDGAAYQNVLILNDSIKSHLEEAKNIREKSKVTANLKKAGKQIHQSNIEYQKAINLGEQAIQIIESDKSFSRGIVVQDEVAESVMAEQPKMIKEDPKAELPLKTDSKTEVKVVEKSEVAKPDTLGKEPLLQAQTPVKQVVAQTPKVDVYFTVQILADKKPVSESALKGVYSGSYPIILNKGDGWHRYSFGKFKTLDAAKKAMEESKTKGYVVAYKNEVRISLSEAKLLLDVPSK